LSEFVTAVNITFSVDSRWYSSAILWRNGRWHLLGSIWWLCITWCPSPGHLS